MRNEIKKVREYIKKMINGADSHFVYIPVDSFQNTARSFPDGLVVDLQELDYLSIEDVSLISENKVDSVALHPDKLDEMDKRFFLHDEPGFSIIFGTVSPPWIEYIMQHFSNCFIRIGVDTPEPKEIENMLDSMLSMGG